MFYKDYCKDALLKDLHNVEPSVQSWMICTTLNDLYYSQWFVQRVEWFVLCWIIWTSWVICTLLNDCNTLKDWYHNVWFALGSMICTGVKYLYHGNIGVVLSSLFLTIENKYPNFVCLLD